jgi:F-type H+-transporting ATPase subunit delta
MSLLNSKKIALRYASALAEINLAESIIEELTTVKEVFNNPQMQLFINNPKFDEKLKNQTLDQLFKDKVSTDVLKTLKLLLKKNRLSIAPHLLEAYEKTFYDKKDILIANIASPKELDENQLAELKVK